VSRARIASYVSLVLRSDGCRPTRSAEIWTDDSHAIKSHGIVRWGGDKRRARNALIRRSAPNRVDSLPTPFQHADAIDIDERDRIAGKAMNASASSSVAFGGAKNLRPRRRLARRGDASYRLTGGREQRRPHRRDRERECTSTMRASRDRTQSALRHLLRDTASHMATDAMVHVRMDKKLKAKAERALAALGMSVAELERGEAAGSAKSVKEFMAAMHADD
jgi:hypothetical protein